MNESAERVALRELIDILQWLLPFQYRHLSKAEQETVEKALERGQAALSPEVPTTTLLTSRWQTSMQELLHLACAYVRHTGGMSDNTDQDTIDRARAILASHSVPAAPVVPAEPDLRKLLLACQLAMEESMRYYGKNSTNWGHMIYAIDAALAAGQPSLPAINPRTGEPWRLSDPEIAVHLEAELEEMRRDPSKARAWLLEGGFITADGQLHENYGGPAVAPVPSDAPSADSVLVHQTDASLGAVPRPSPSLGAPLPMSAEQGIRHLLWGLHPECCGRVIFDENTLGGERCCGRPDLADLNDAQIVSSLRAMFPEAK